MSAELGPGTPLIFIGPDTIIIPSGLTIGAMYFVRDVRPAMCGAPVVTLKGTPGNFAAYCTCRFRPIQDGERDLTEKEIDFPIEYTKKPEHA